MKKARTTAPKPKKSAKEVGTCSLNKKEIGDRVKAALALEKYHIPQMRFDVSSYPYFFLFDLLFKLWLSRT